MPHSSEVRFDSLTGRQLILAKSRGLRPLRLGGASSRPPLSPDPHCPFCAGHESLTPKETASLGGENGASWRVRVIPNLYPAVDETVAVSQGVGSGAAGSGAGSRNEMSVQPGYGRHEVVIESPDHLGSLAEITPGDAQLSFAMYAARIRAMRSDAGIRYAIAFRNTGPDAGASQEHVHGQVLGLPCIPPGIVRKLELAADSFRHSGRCGYCQRIEEEEGKQARLVFAGEHVMAICPWASRFPFEVMILPRRHAARFEDAPSEVLVETSQIAQLVAMRFDSLLDRPSYNLAIHTAPFDSLRYDHYHWHIELFPRLTKTAGFEWGADAYLHHVPPEEAAKALREETGG